MKNALALLSIGMLAACGSSEPEPAPTPTPTVAAPRTLVGADLDLSTSAGVAELYRRVERAVNRICDGDRDCRDEAWASTEEQASAAIARDRWMRRLARERAAELRACGRYGCAPSAPVRYQPAPPPPLVVQGGTRVTVTIQTGGPGYYVP